ncbi:MAG TPA: MarR family transcriptional regulator [Thermoanaerobaculia bacterium]|nr:MarR family transcriptional regulator [Thermoanaerobaculia bacterium]
MNELIAAIQRSYPQIYFACHVDHVRKKSSVHRLSSHDSAILAHLDVETPLSPRALARHLGVVPSTLSASIAGLESLGYLTRTPRTEDRRTIELRLTERGAAAMRETSVLDPVRVGQLLAQLGESERRRAVEGIVLLARAARELAAAPGAVRRTATPQRTRKES